MAENDSEVSITSITDYEKKNMYVGMLDVNASSMMAILRHVVALSRSDIVC